MEYTDVKRLIDSLLVKNKETEWIEFKENFHSKEEIGSGFLLSPIVLFFVICHTAILCLALMTTR